MNRNALTEQRRETVIGLLKGMNIEKSPNGGFDKDAVYDCMQQLCDLYENSIEELENAYESELGQLKERYQKYDENNELYVSLIMEAKKSSNDIISQAKTEVETILAEGKAHVEQQEQELALLKIDMETEKQAMVAEINAAREAMEAEKAAMKAEVEAEKEKAFAAKNKYTQQLNAMEAEFEEIKTNILRTAGKIDSLKSKLPNDEEAEWKMMNELDAVGFPAAEIEVDNVVEAPVAFDSYGVGEEIISGDVEENIPSNVEEIISGNLEEAPADSEPFTLEELTLEDITVDLPDFINEAPAAEEPVAAPVEEISFEGLEELFKDEN